MNILIDFAHWALHDGVYGTVIVGAVVLAWLAWRAEGATVRRYDAWWFHHIPGSRFLRP
jgi:hypothetical protein